MISIEDISNMFGNNKRVAITLVPFVPAQYDITGGEIKFVRLNHPEQLIVNLEDKKQVA